MNYHGHYVPKYATKFCEHCHEALDSDGLCENTYYCYANGRDVACYDCFAYVDDSTGKMIKNKNGEFVAVCASKHQMEVV